MHVAVFGAGYAGVTLARRLERQLPSEADLTVVDESESHLLQHELHRAIRRPGIEDAIRVPLAEAFDRATVVRATVTDVDPAESRAILDGDDAPDELAYDYGAVCLGAETAYYGIEGLREHSIPLKRWPHAQRIREAALDACRGGGRIVVGGAGLSGVQVAGELATLARERDAADRLDVVLLEQESTVAPGFRADFREAVDAELRDRGVDVRTGTAVRRVAADAIETDRGEVGYDRLVWTGGIGGPAALGGERPAVRADLRLSDSTFVVGDAARVVDADGEPVPASAAAAIREARTVADNLTRLVDGDGGFGPRLDQYRFDVPGWIVSVGDGTVAQVGPTVVTGAAAKAMKTSVGAGYLASTDAIARASRLVEAELGGDHD